MTPHQFDQTVIAETNDYSFGNQQRFTFQVTGKSQGSFARMISFLDLPTEVRLIIYHHSLNPSEYVSAYAKITDQEPPYGPNDGPSCSFPRPYVERSTPSILLVNRQITSEALEVLYRKPLHLYGTPGAWFAMRQVDITEFISEELLQRVHHAILHLPHPEKNFVLTVLNIWGERNQLQRLDVEWPKGVADSDSRHWQIVRSRVCTLHRLKLTDANSLLALDIFRHGSSPFSRARRAYRKPLRIPDSIG